MNFLKIFHRRKREPKTPQPLHIENTTTRLTPEPDDAELAAQALLENMAEEGAKRKKGGHRKKAEKKEEPEPGSVEYYRAMSEKIRKAHAQEARRAKRYVAYAEEQLRSPLFNGVLAEVERGLYPLQDCIEREGGELKKRWQKCLAECIVRQMSEGSGENFTDEENTGYSDNEPHK